MLPTVKYRKNKFTDRQALGLEHTMHADDGM